MMDRAVLLTLSLFISLSASLVSKPSSEEKLAAQDPTLEQVLDRYVQALGGKLAIERINSRASKGTFTSIQSPTSIEAGGEFNRRIGRARSLQLGRFILGNPLVSMAEKVAGDAG